MVHGTSKWHWERKSPDGSSPLGYCKGLSRLFFLIYTSILPWSVYLLTWFFLPLLCWWNPALSNLSSAYIYILKWMMDNLNSISLRLNSRWSQSVLQFSTTSVSGSILARSLKRKSTRNLALVIDEHTHQSAIQCSIATYVQYVNTLYCVPPFFIHWQYVAHVPCLLLIDVSIQSIPRKKI